MPATIDDVFAHLRDVRDDDSLRRFPVVIPADPQPLSTAAFFVAYPAWAQDSVLAVFHLPTWPERVFSSLVLPRVSREELLVIAGFGSSSQVDVFAAGEQTPLQRGEQVDTFPGITVTIQPIGSPPPLQRSLRSMLVWLPYLSLPYLPCGCLRIGTRAGLLWKVLRQLASGMRLPITLVLCLPI